MSTQINGLKIKQFRHLKDLDIEFGSRITAIAGANGTGKSSLLGLISGAFVFDKTKGLTLFNKKSFSADFSEIFTFSQKKEGKKVNLYKYEISLSDGQKAFGGFRYSVNNKSRPFRIDILSGEKKDKKKIQFPIIYLGLRRFFPLAQEINPKINITRRQDDEYKNWFEKYYKAILPTEKPINYENYKSENKGFLSVITDEYDSYGSSAGQDNLSQILSAIYSFKKLKDQLDGGYFGGALIIDEVDVSFYPGAQINLIKYLHRLAGELNLQVIFTTHSLEILESLAHKDYKPHSKYVFLEKISDDFICYKKDEQDIDNIISDLRHRIKDKAEVTKNKKISVLCEDNEAVFIAKGVLDSKIKKQLEFKKVNLGCANYEQLLKKGILDDKIIILDGDSKNKINDYKNLVFLPGNKRPENVIMDFLDSISPTDDFWKSKNKYTKQTFLSRKELEIDNRDKMKKWFNRECKCWGVSGKRVFDKWRIEKHLESEKFDEGIEQIIKIIRK
ncbi:MAG: AAA family ATPase [Candidatus Paceibacterota bacterium]|jgi:ABC-type multidrug transport system ATPase subunit